MREFIPYSRQNVTQEDTEAVLQADAIDIDATKIS